jgi:hypothetical protein
VAPRDRRKCRVNSRLAAPRRPTEWTIREQADAVLHAVGGNTAQEVMVVPDAQLDLDRIDLGKTPRLLDLSDRHVAETNLLNQAVSLQSGQRADAGRERNPRIRNVQLVEIDAVDAERHATPAARLDEMFRAAIRFPSAVRPPEAALGRNPDERSIAGPRRQGLRNQAFVVAALTIIPGVGIGRIEKRDARIEGGMQNADRDRLVTIALRRQPHASEADAREQAIRSGCHPMSSARP